MTSEAPRNTASATSPTRRYRYVLVVDSLCMGAIQAVVPPCDDVQSAPTGLLTPSYAGADTTVLIPGFVAGNGHNGLMPPSAAQPQVVAHRGASFEKAEHTLGAYVKALDAGAQGLECDVRLTADGHLVCAHDRDLRRTAARKGLISTSNLEDLEALDFASWKNPWAELDDEATEPDPRLNGVLTLRKLLEAVADYDRRVEVAIETKHPTRYGGLVERRVAQMLHDFGWGESSGGQPSPARV